MEIVGGKVLVDNFGGIFLVARFIHFEDSPKLFRDHIEMGNTFKIRFKKMDAFNIIMYQTCQNCDCPKEPIVIF